MGNRGAKGMVVALAFGARWVRGVQRRGRATRDVDDRGQSLTGVAGRSGDVLQGIGPAT